MGDDLSVRVGVDSSVSAGLAKVQQSIDSFKEEASHSFSEVAGDFGKMFAAGAIIESFKGIAEEMERTQKLAIRFGESAESIQRVSQAANQNGTDIETVAKSMQKVTVNAVEAIRGNKEYAQAFEDLGINAKEFIDLPLTDKLAVLSDAYSKNTDGNLRVADAQKVLSKGAAELIPLLQQGGDALRAQFAEANVASQDTVDTIAETTEKLTHIFDTLKTDGAIVLGGIIKFVTAATEAFAILYAWITNLPHGFKAAREAADEATEGVKLLHEEQAKEKEAREKANEHKSGDTARGIEAKQEAEDKANKAKQAENDLASLEAQNAAKKNEYYERHISLAEKELDMKKRLVELQISDSVNYKDKNQLVKNDNERLDITAALEKNAAEQKKAGEESIKEADKIAKEKARVEIEAKKEALTKAEKSLSSLEHGDHFSVDSLRAIGGGVAGVNYHNVASKEELQKQAVQYQKETVEQLKQVIKALENSGKTPFSNAGDGSFTLS